MCMIHKLVFFIIISLLTNDFNLNNALVFLFGSFVSSSSGFLGAGKR